MQKSKTLFLKLFVSEKDLGVIIKKLWSIFDVDGNYFEPFTIWPSDEGYSLIWLKDFFELFQYYGKVHEMLVEYEVREIVLGSSEDHVFELLRSKPKGEPFKAKVYPERFLTPEWKKFIEDNFNQKEEEAAKQRDEWIIVWQNKINPEHKGMSQVPMNYWAAKSSRAFSKLCQSKNLLFLRLWKKTTKTLTFRPFKRKRLKSCNLVLPLLVKMV